MQNALICLLPIRLTSQRQSAARGFQPSACGMMRCAMTRKRRNCRLQDSCSAQAYWARSQAAVIQVLSAARVDELAKGEERQR